MTKPWAAAIAAVIACGISFVGWWAFIVSVHGSGPGLTLLQWVGLPFFSALTLYDREYGNLVYWWSIAGSVWVWWLLVFALLRLSSKREARA